MKNWKTIGILTAVTALSAGVALHAQPGPADGQGFAPRRGQFEARDRQGPPPIAQQIRKMLSRLDLSEEQRGQVREILSGYRNVIETQKESMKAAHEVLRDAVNAPQPDNATIRGAADALGEVLGEGAVLRKDIIQDIRAILTPEQREELDTIRASRQEFREIRQRQRKERQDFLRENRTRGPING